uniref:Cytochrome b6/f complex subunit V n=1 Tax=Steinernema glaseri TaxID=37863 RepID=A0A1I7Y2N2_9BILA
MCPLPDVLSLGFQVALPLRLGGLYYYRPDEDLSPKH